MPTRRAAKKNIVIEQGNHFSWPLRLFQTDVLTGRYLHDTTGYTSKFTVRDGDFDGDIVLQYTQANYITVGWTPAKAARSTAYGLGQEVVPDAGLNGFIYRCTGAGTTGASAPTWPTLLEDVVADGTVEWTVVSSDEYVASLYLAVPSSVTAALADWGVGVYTWTLTDTYGQTQRLFQGTAMLSREAS